MLQALSTNIFSAANDEASTASSSSSSGSSSGAAELFPGLESGMWSATPADTTMDSEENNYCYVLHTATTAAGPAMQWAACSGSNGLVRVYDVAHPRGQLPLLATLDQKKVAGDAAITGVTFLSGGTAPGAVLTCSENGRMFLWDVRTPAAPAVKFSAPPVGGMSMSCVCSRLDGKVVAAGVGSSIRLWDVGTRKVIAVYEEAHTDDVTAIRFHPFAPSQLITGSLDGLVCITDTSVPPTPEGDEDEGDTLVSGKKKKKKT